MLDSTTFHFDYDQPVTKLYSNMAGTFRLTTMDDKTSLQQSRHSDCAAGNADEGEAIEKSYQSKTTIRRTEQGM